MTTKRTPRDRGRTPPIDPGALELLFIELEKVSLSRRNTRKYIDLEDKLAWMVHLHAEHRFDAHRVNDRDLINRPPNTTAFRKVGRRCSPCGRSSSLWPE
jgi:hypothetical protein